MKFPRNLLPLHLLFLLYSVCGILGKLSANQDYMSLAFIAFYGAALLVLVIYSLLWQRILAKMPLTTAFSNKGITIIWGIVWGAVIFDEKITVAKVLAAIFIVSGIAVIGKAES